METSKKSTGKKSKGQTSSAEVTRVNLSVRQVNGEVKKIRGICGHGSEQPLASYDLDTQSWKMFGDISLWGDSPSLLNLPVSGMTRNGVLFLQHPWEPITAETALSSWPTPVASDAWTTDLASSQVKEGSMHSVSLGRAVQMWPTPTADDASNVNPKPNRFRGLVAAVNMWPTPTSTVRPMEGNVRLYRAKVQAGEMTEAEAEAILGKSVWEAQGKLPEMWPTPTAHPNNSNKNGKFKNPTLGDAARANPYPTMSASGMGNTGSRQMLDKKIAEGSLTEEEKLAMTAGNGGKLNPTWVEWLMGFPEGWTDLED